LLKDRGVNHPDEKTLELVEGGRRGRRIHPLEKQKASSNSQSKEGRLSKMLLRKEGGVEDNKKKGREE